MLTLIFKRGKCLLLYLRIYSTERGLISRHSPPRVGQTPIRHTSTKRSDHPWLQARQKVRVNRRHRRERHYTSRVERTSEDPIGDTRNFGSFLVGCRGTRKESEDFRSERPEQEKDKETITRWPVPLVDQSGPGPSDKKTKQKKKRSMCQPQLKMSGSKIWHWLGILFHV